MKRTLIFLIFIVLTLPSCIKGDHIARKYNMEGYAYRMMDLYYDEVMSGHRWGASEGYSYTQLDEHTWQCLVIEDEAVSSRVQVIVTELDNSETVVIDGNRYEDNYTTRVFTLDGGIVDDRGVLRVEVYRADHLAGWAEVDVHSREVTVGN